jgi:hypothetical protein
LVINVRTAIRRRLPRRDDDTGSLIFALLLIFLATALASLMTPVLLISINGTRSDQSRVAQLAAAESGIDVMMGQIRAANDGTAPSNGFTAGVLSKLPCGTFTGPVSAGGNSRYSATVAYYPADPRGQSAAWLTANLIQCIPNAGARSAPAFALLTSQGTDLATGSFASLSSTQTRTVFATYIFQSTNANITGGLVHVYKTSGSTDLCIDAGAGSPVAGTSVTMQPCSSGKAQQTWAYNTNLTISLVSTQVNGSLGMCLDAGTPEAANLVVKVQTCGTVTEPQQQWSFNDSANLMGTSDGATLNNLCFNVQNQNVSGSFVILSSNCNGGKDNVQNWTMDPSVGAGAAGSATGELVNFSQFGRCLDVTNFIVTSPSMIAYPCKQAPNPTNVAWNQRWTVPTVTGSNISATGSISTNDLTDGNTYCLTSPQAVGYGNWVTLTKCPNTLPASMTWTVYGKTSTYATSYEITDGSTPGLCLQPSDPNSVPVDMFDAANGISNMIVATCNGSLLQKWNANPNILAALPLKDFGEK